MKKSKHLAEIGARGGKVGGKARTQRKRQAAARNAARARKFLLTKRICVLCKKRKLAARNKSGICRRCQWAGVNRWAGMKPGYVTVWVETLRRLLEKAAGSPIAKKAKA